MEKKSKTYSDAAEVFEAGTDACGEALNALQDVECHSEFLSETELADVQKAIDLMDLLNRCLDTDHGYMLDKAIKEEENEAAAEEVEG